MQSLAPYQINIASLKNQDYDYNFVVQEAFFAHFPHSLIERGNLKANLRLRKSETMMELDFEIKGSIELICDRSLEAFAEPIHIKEKLILKFSDHNEEVTDELEFIARGTTDINVAQYLYEFINLAVPIKKLHPKFRNEPEDDAEEILVYSSENIDNQNNHPEDESIDPRWQALKKLKK
ncbi:MAG: DUF177 domain-containing protein [Microscillaceae bacterium]|nr:DUF177 domain-containing protein [Microscillaceae bacterium]